MIDFRYHLISLIAVFLALGLGILMGSVVLSEQYVERLQRRVEEFGRSLDESRKEVSLLEQRVDALQGFALEAEPLLVDGALAGEEVVAVVLDGTDPALMDGISEAVESAGGTLVSTISLTGKFELADQPERDQLATILGSSSADPVALREEAASAVGDRSAAAASAGVGAGPSGAGRRLVTLLDDLQENDFIGVSSAEDVPVPSGAAFLVAGGSEAEPVDGAVAMGVELAKALSRRGRAVMVATTTDAAWDLVKAVRDEPAGASIATADHADTTPGRIAVVLGLGLALDGVVDHYGTDAGAATILPRPTPLS